MCFINAVFVYSLEQLLLPRLHLCNCSGLKTATYLRVAFVCLRSSGAERNQVLASTSRESKKNKWVLDNSKTLNLFVWLLFKFGTPDRKSVV